MCLIDLVHHAPYSTSPNIGGGAATGIPVPLFNLVYHDSLLQPWDMGDNSGSPAVIGGSTTPGRMGTRAACIAC